MVRKKPARLSRDVSAIGFGTWNISGQWSGTDDKEAIRAIHAALDAGIDFFDTAPIYGFGHAEEVLGRALEGRRDRAFIASKCGLVWSGDAEKHVDNNLSPESLLVEVDEVLTRLKTDHIDLWQIHWPNDAYPLGETIGALREIQAQGKILAYGVCNFSAERVAEAEKYGQLASYQGLYNMLERDPSVYHAIDLEYRSESEIFPIVRDLGMAFLPYSPLMQGLLSGKIRGPEYFANKDVRDSNSKLKGERLLGHLAVVEELLPIAADVGVSLAQLALAWLVAKDEVTSVIAGARTVEQIEANAAAGDLTLGDDTMAAISAVLERHQEFLE